MDNIIVSSSYNNNITIGKYKTNAVRAAALTEYSVHWECELNAGLILIVVFFFGSGVVVMMVMMQR